MTKLFTDKNSGQRLLNYLRAERKKTGLSQRELGIILYGNEGPISKHERFQASPSLLMAIGYEIVFQLPVSEIFAGFRDGIAEIVERRLTELEADLGKRSARGSHAASTAQKLEWLIQRRHSRRSQPDNHENDSV